MALFHFGTKKNDEKKEPACSCGGAREASAPAQTSNHACCGKPADDICCIQVLGSGCKSCHALLENTREAVKTMGLSAQVEYITDMQKIMEYGLMQMPGLAVNGKVVSMGKVLKPGDVEKLLQNLEV